MLKALSVVGYFGMVGGLVYLIWSRSLFSSSPFVICLQAAALLLFVWARVSFGRRSYHVVADPTRGGLVTAGPYHYIRHPHYGAFCLLTTAGAAAHWSWKIGICTGLIIASALVRIFCEETLVAQRYPEYRDYAKRTWRVIPHIF